MPSPTTVAHLLLLLLLLLLSLTTALTCHPSPPRTPLPLSADCHELIDALIASSHFPSHSIPKAWGRDLPSTALTEHLPKLYWIVRNPALFSAPTTCGVQLDVEATEPWAVETFGLLDVGQAAERVVERCLLRREEVGWEGVGGGGRVEVRLVRVDKGWVGGEVEGVERVSGGRGRGRVLMSSGVNVTRIGRGVPWKFWLVGILRSRSYFFVGVERGKASGVVEWPGWKYWRAA